MDLTPSLTPPTPANDPIDVSDVNSILPVTVSNLRFQPGDQTLLDDVSFTLAAGPRTIILGPNGAGKSLLLRLTHGLLPATAGSIKWASRDAERRQAMVFQRPVLLRRSVAANVDYGLKLRGVSKADRSDITEDVLNRTGLARFRDKPARLLSGGEQQKLALARAWALKPEILFLDEPTSHLDPAATHAVEEIVEIMHEQGTRIVMTTHDLGQAKRLADEVIFIHKGRLMEKTPAADFFEQPESGEAAAFLKGELRW